MLNNFSLLPGDQQIGVQQKLSAGGDKISKGNRWAGPDEAESLTNKILGNYAMSKDYNITTPSGNDIPVDHQSEIIIDENDRTDEITTFFAGMGHPGSGGLSEQGAQGVTTYYLGVNEDGTAATDTDKVNAYIDTFSSEDGNGGHDDETIAGWFLGFEPPSGSKFYPKEIVHRPFTKGGTMNESSIETRILTGIGYETY